MEETSAPFEFTHWKPCRTRLLKKRPTLRKESIKDKGTKEGRGIHAGLRVQQYIAICPKFPEVFADFPGPVSYK
jgi:hypothetical protein